jgi:4-diphosphocytidyl-2-C-methyl-D-erythritol kinase
LQTKLSNKTLRWLCPAKVNLYLRVAGRRADGYHDLVTVMQPLTLADELILSRQGAGLSLECDHPELMQQEENLIWRAARAFEEATGRESGVHITLRKRIPMAAGLGGGSSDAAGTLLALNHLHGGPLTVEQLHRLAGRLGADVPFFLYGRPALARGIGTELTPMALPPYSYLLANPGLPLSTRWVYENLDLERLPGAPVPEAWDPEHPERWVRNDLGAVALGRFPELGGLLSQLQALGAVTEGISGSGPTVFGLFATLEAAREAGRSLRRNFPGWLAAARGLTGAEADISWEEQTWRI